MCCERKASLYKWAKFFVECPHLYWKIHAGSSVLKYIKKNMDSHSFKEKKSAEMFSGCSSRRRNPNKRFVLFIC